MESLGERVLWVLEATAVLAKEINVTDKWAPGLVVSDSNQDSLKKESQVFRSAKEGMVFLQADVHHLLDSDISTVWCSHSHFTDNLREAQRG